MRKYDFLSLHALIIVSIFFLITGMIFGLRELGKIEKEQLAASVLVAKSPEIDEQIFKIREERKERKEQKIREEDILPSNFENLGISAKAFILAKVSGRQLEQPEQFNIVYQKNAYQKLPIASLTKLMTALIAIQNYKLDDIIVISEDAISTESNGANFREGEKMLVFDLLKTMLVESDNDSAEALAQKIGRGNFIKLMNGKAADLGLKNTNFANPSGLDDENNYSTANDLSKLVNYLLSDSGFKLIWEITRIGGARIYSLDGMIYHDISNTNRLLSGEQNIYGGKTGFTEKARGCMMLVLKIKDGYLVSVVLGSEERFADTLKLIETYRN